MLAPFFAFTALGLLTSHRVTAAPYPDLRITKLLIHRADDANTTIAFRVHDPNPLGNFTTECSGTWKAFTRGFPHDYNFQSCNDSVLGWEMDGFVNIKNFTLSLVTTFADPSVGDASDDLVTAYYKTKIEEPEIVCTAVDGQSCCAQEPDTIFYAPVYALVA